MENSRRNQGPGLLSASNVLSAPAPMTYNPGPTGGKMQRLTTSPMPIQRQELDLIAALRRNIESVIFGKPDVVKLTVTCLLARGHVLLEDVPGIGKTALARATAKSIACAFRRIQFTPDLLPSDVTGVSIFDPDRKDFAFKRGPVFSNIILADEINRATPRTQAALLEAMNENRVSVDGITHALAPRRPRPCAGGRPRLRDARRHQSGRRQRALPPRRGEAVPRVPGRPGGLRPDSPEDPPGNPGPAVAAGVEKTDRLFFPLAQ